MKCKKIVIVIGVIAVSLLGVAGLIKNVVYERAGEYMVTQVLENQLTSMIKEELGIDMGEVGKELTEEEIAKLQESTLSKEHGQREEKVPQESMAEKLPGNVDKAVEIKSDVTEKLPTTTDELKKIVDQKVQEVAKMVPSKDKKAMTNLVLSNLAMSDIQYLVSIVLDGVSGEDLTIAKGIALRSFDERELMEVRGYYNKYRYLIP